MYREFLDSPRYRVGKLLSIDSNPKVMKNAGSYRVAILHLTPADGSGDYNLCPHASAGCRSACLHTAGNPVWLKGKLAARLARTRLFMEHRAEFIRRLSAELRAFVDSTLRKGLRPAVRLNGTSDIRWEKVCPKLFTMWPDVQFYDYTKDAGRLDPSYKLPPNYRLLFSRSETNNADCIRIMGVGHNVTVVYRDYGISAHPKPFPRFLSLPGDNRLYPVVDGDKSDLRFADPQGCIVALRAKGDGRKDTSGFVV